MLRTLPGTTLSCCTKLVKSREAPNATFLAEVRVSFTG